MVCLAGICLSGGMTEGGTTGDLQFFQESQSHMGTKWHIALYAADAEAANMALKRAWREIGEINDCLSNYSANSELNRFCRTSPHASPIHVSKHLATVLHAATKVSRQSDGYFDVTIGPIANLWRRARAKHALPETHRLMAAREKVNWQFVEFGPEPRQVRISKAGVKIDLGGIAKGYAVDRAISILQAAGIQSALVNGGGDLRAIGTTPKSDGWNVEIANVKSNDKRRAVTLHNAALATSGDAWNYLEIGGKRYSHLIDPKTGIGSTRRLSVSVYALTCMQADAMASALKRNARGERPRLSQAVTGCGSVRRGNHPLGRRAAAANSEFPPVPISSKWSTAHFHERRSAGSVDLDSDR